MSFEKLTDYLDSLEEKYGIPACDCIVTKDHEIMYRHLAGHFDYEKKIPLKEDCLYRLFSATKVVTMTATLQLIEQGKLGLYDELTDYIPEFGKLKVADEFKFEFPIHWPTARSSPASSPRICRNVRTPEPRTSCRGTLRRSCASAASNRAHAR